MPAARRRARGGRRASSRAVSRPWLRPIRRRCQGRGGARPSAATITRLRPMCGRFTQQRPASELAEIFGAEPLSTTRASATTSPRRTRRPSSSSARTGAPSPPTAGGSSRTGPRTPRSGRGCSTPAPRRSPPARPSATRSCASAASCRSIRSTSGSARARSASRTGSCGATAGRSPWPGCGRAGATRPRETVRRTFTIVTTTPNEALERPPRPDAGRHLRGRLGRWLDPAPADPSELLGLLVPNEEVELEVYAVERFVNDVRRDGPELIEPLVPAPADRRSCSRPAEGGPPASVVRDLGPAVRLDRRAERLARLDAIVERGRERPDEVGEDAVRVGLGCLEHDDIGRQVGPARPSRRRRRGPSAPRPIVRRRRRPRRRRAVPARRRRRPRSPSGSASPRSTSAASMAGPSTAGCAAGAVSGSGRVEVIGRARAGSARAVAQQRHVADAATREVEDDAVGRRVVAGLADQLDGAPCPRGGKRDARRHARRPRSRRRRRGRWASR